jgi:hypothetical protein
VQPFGLADAPLLLFAFSLLPCPFVVRCIVTAIAAIAALWIFANFGIVGVGIVACIPAAAAALQS